MILFCFKHYTILGNDSTTQRKRKNIAFVSQIDPGHTVRYCGHQSTSQRCILLPVNLGVDIDGAEI